MTLVPKSPTVSRNHVVTNCRLGDLNMCMSTVMLLMDCFSSEIATQDTLIAGSAGEQQRRRCCKVFARVVTGWEKKIKHLDTN